MSAPFQADDDGTTNMIEDALTEVQQSLAELRAGADPTPVADGTPPSPGQLYQRILDRPDQRVMMLAGLMQQADLGEKCYRLDHEVLIERLRARVSAFQAENESLRRVLSASKRPRFVARMLRKAGVK